MDGHMRSVAYAYCGAHDHALVQTGPCRSCEHACARMLGVVGMHVSAADASAQSRFIVKPMSTSMSLRVPCNGSSYSAGPNMCIPTLSSTRCSKPIQQPVT